MMGAKAIGVAGCVFVLAVIVAALSVGGIVLPYVLLTWSTAFLAKPIIIGWWAGAAIQLAGVWFISRKTMWIILGLGIITYIMENSGAFQ